MSSKRGGRGQPQGKQYGPKKQTPPPLPQQPPVTIVVALLPKGVNAGEWGRRMRRRDPDFDKKIEIINSLYNDFNVKVDMKSFSANPEKYDLDQVLSPFKDTLVFMKKEFPEFFDYQKTLSESGPSASTFLSYLKNDIGLATDTYAQYNWFNGFQFGDILAGNNLKSFYEHDVATQHHPQGTTYKDVLPHEFGHALHNLIQIMDYKAKVPDASWLEVAINQKKEHQTRNTAKKIVKKALQNLGYKGVTLDNVNKIMHGKISVYANQNAAETIAESMGDVKANGTKAKALSRSVFEVVKKSIKYGGFDAYIAAEKKNKKGK